MKRDGIENSGIDGKDLENLYPPDEISKFQRRLLCSFEMERACRATDILDAKCIIDFIDSVYSARFPAPTTGPRPYRVAPLLKRPKMIHL